MGVRRHAQECEVGQRRQVTATERRASGPPFRFDWRRVDLRRITRHRRTTRFTHVTGNYTYTTQPSELWALDVWKARGAWRWGIVMLPEGATIHESGLAMPTMARAKRAAENWYAEHGGKVAQEEIIWIDVPTDAVPF